jgi:hypothetical protein
VPPGLSAGSSGGNCAASRLAPSADLRAAVSKCRPPYKGRLRHLRGENFGRKCLHRPHRGTASSDTIRAISRQLVGSPAGGSSELLRLLRNWWIFEGSAKTPCILVVRNSALNADVLSFQYTRRFPSWTSRVRVPSPAPFLFNRLQLTSPCPRLILASSAGA